MRSGLAMLRNASVISRRARLTSASAVGWFICKEGSLEYRRCIDRCLFIRQYAAPNNNNFSSFEMHNPRTMSDVIAAAAEMNASRTNAPMRLNF